MPRRQFHHPRSRTPIPSRDVRDHDRDHRSFFDAVRVVAFFTLISRFGGLFRDVATARVFGSTAVNSAFAFAFMVPNVFRRLFGEGALSAAFIPEYAALDQNDPERARRFASLTVALVTLITAAITLLLEAALLVAVLALPPEPERRLMLLLTMLMLPYMPMVCVAAVLGGMLQVHNRFGPSAASPVILNTFIILATVAAYLFFDLTPAQTAYVVAVAVLLSGLAQVFWSLSILRAHVRWTRVFSGVRDSIRRVLKRFVPVLIGLGALQINTMVDGFIATWPLLVGPTLLGFAYPLDEATNGLLSNTQRLYQFPLGVFGVAVATAVFPALSRAASHDLHLYTNTLRRGLRLSLFIALPASFGLLMVGEDLARVLFKGGNFTEAGVVRSGAIVTGYAVAVWAYSANQVLARAFYARGDTATPMRIALWCVLLNFLLNISLIWVPWIGETALAWSTAIAAVVQTVLLARRARAITSDGALLDSPTRRAALGILTIAALMSAAVLLTLLLLPDPHTTEHNVRWSAVRLASAVAVGIAAYMTLARLTSRPELRWLVSRRAADEPAAPPA